MLVGLAFLFLHPYIFGMRGLIGERLFESRLRVGMSPDDALRMAIGYGAIQGGLQTMPEQPLTRRYRERLDVTFIDFFTFCMDAGRSYSLYFSPDGKLIEWHTEPHSDAC